MSFFGRTPFSKRRLATYLLLWNSYSTDVAAKPLPQEAPEVTTPVVTPVLLTNTGADGSTVVQTFTPTSLAISGLVPPITAATTVTTTLTEENGAVETVAIAVAAGAGIVAAGALAAWLYKPIPGEPPAPTNPPEYSTSSQNNEPPKTTDPPKTSDPPSCPFPTGGSKVDFKKVDNQPQWTAGSPPDNAEEIAPKCEKYGSNNQLLRGTDPGYIKALAEVFCKMDLTKDQSKEIGQPDLPNDSSWKNDKLQSVRVKFDFKYSSTHDGCAKNCNDAVGRILSMCQYDSHSMFGGGSLEQGCGTYNFMVNADPRTESSCKNPSSDIFVKYMYRDAAIDAINNFCTAQDGHVLKAKDDGSYIKESAFTASYSDKCTGSGSYTIEKDLCVKYLSETVDNCDTGSVNYKHGGITTDTDNCGAFEFHPNGVDVFSCYPDNKDKGFISQGEHIAISPEMAEDVISQFCDRSGDGQSYTLDPDKIPASNAFIQDTCAQDGMAACAYYYTNDGKRVTDKGSLGDLVVRAEAAYQDFGTPQNWGCGARQKYEIHGDRCKRYLRKVMGVEPKGQCVGSDPSKLDLGSFLESGDKGCVLWNFYAVNTH
ncbi:hypothetical protein EJ05DRAFT_475364 [Pseudovirgaria hyperparasitica]|uniref:Uncharacterized protein n=1 Tax=Pseudovirgaria hyperparasitica TaxID=470096 RepID=A0A6A6WAS0_9PEZI|nr:uncharacterized protein EJ05DRAFT_475364 [Pseudovirgaria hyperparasitica]KAF2759134.1 hypothetical protein EJ05DRAFT_475364 [Pseudovirgaria hyperparasitica]